MCLGAFGFAFVVTVLHSAEIVNHAFAAAALLVLGLAGYVIVRASEPSLAPLTGRSHVIAHSLGFTAIVLETASQWGSDAYVRDNWGPISLGLLFVALSPYRPATELASAGILSSIGVGFITLLQIHSFAEDAPAVAFIVVAVSPMIALCLSSAIFSNGTVVAVERWRKRAKESSATLVRDFQGDIARSVRKDRVTILDRDVLPFFAEVLAKRELSAEDRTRASEIADAIRRVMVEEVDRNWIETIIELTQRDDPRTGSIRNVVSDPDHVASAMSIDQRTAIRALLVVFLEQPGFDWADLRVVFVAEGDRGHALISATVSLPERGVRTQFAPYFAIMRALFTNVRVDFSQPTLTLRFSYELN
jgi:hypothetical protein